MLDIFKNYWFNICDSLSKNTADALYKTSQSFSHIARIDNNYFKRE